MSHLARNLRLIRVSRGLNQAALATRSGLGQPYISALERGLRPSRTEHVERLASALGVDVDALLSERLIVPAQEVA